MIDPVQMAALKQQARPLVDARVRRLEALLAEHEAQEDDDGQTDGHACFDDSPEGERVHRYQSRWSRLLLRTLDAIGDLRNQPTLAGSDPPEKTEAEEHSARAPEPVVAAQQPVEAAAAAPISASEPGPETLPPSALRASGSVAGSIASGPIVKSAKQSHREDGERRAEEHVGSSDGGYPRGGGGKSQVF